MGAFVQRLGAMMMALMLYTTAATQVPLSLDGTFECSFNTWYVASVLPLEDGSILASGRMKFGNDLNFKNMMRFMPDGSRDMNFATNGAGGGAIKRWDNKLYVGVGQEVRRLYLDGELDNDFITMSTQPFYSALQGGDYHVYPDGSILMSGAHSLYDTARGFVGIYNLIWFTNTGHLDTTKTHRYCNGVIYEIEQQPDGKFLCSGSCTTYEGQPVRRIFRVHADGALDTSFDSQVTWGKAGEFLVLEDERIMVVGRFGRPDLPNDTIRMACLLSNGDLDPSFDHTISFGLGDIPNALDLGVIPNSIAHWPGGRFVVTGTYQVVNGEPRYGLCVVDSSGMLMPEFSNAGVGTYVYQGQVLGGVSGVYLTPDNMLYVYGTFHGYTDGTTNDPDQRFITRLYGPDLTTAVFDATAPVPATVRVAPNPTTGQFTLSLPADLGPAQARLLDASGRVVQHYTLAGGAEQQHLSTNAEAGTYLLLVEARAGQQWQARVVVE
jgi:uncharacterized delta-60 repeat protein